MDAVTLSLSPLVPPALAYGLGALALAVAILALVRGLKGWLWRALAGLVLTGALLNPALVQETREPLSDVMVLITDDSASMQIGNRSAAAEQTAQALRALAESDPLLDLVEVSGGASEDGTRLNRACSKACRKPRAIVWRGSSSPLTARSMTRRQPPTTWGLKPRSIMS